MIRKTIPGGEFRAWPRPRRSTRPTPIEIRRQVRLERLAQLRQRLVTARWRPIRWRIQPRGRRRQYRRRGWRGADHG